MNEIILKGVVVSDLEFSHEFSGEKFYEFKLQSKRLSGISDVLKCLISEIYIEKIKKGSYIVTKAMVRTYNNRNNKKLDVFVFISDKPTVGEYEEDLMDINEVTVEGYICKQMPFRKTPLGREVTDFIVAVNRAYGKSDYIPVIAWGRNAKRTSLLPVGSKVKIKGRLQSREYQKRLEDKIENKVAYELSARTVLDITDMEDN